MPERGRILKGRPGNSVLDCGGFWPTNDEGGFDFVETTPPSAVDQLAEVAREDDDDEDS